MTALKAKGKVERAVPVATGLLGYLTPQLSVTSPTLSTEPSLNPWGLLKVSCFLVQAEVCIDFLLPRMSFFVH